MEIIMSKRYELEIELTGETHTLCNPIKKILMKDDDVKSAAYIIEHPVIAEPKLYIKSKSPKKSLKSSAKELKKLCTDFKSEIDDNIK